MASLKASLHCRICRRIGATVLLSILAIEAAILIPSYKNYERDLLLRLQSAGRAEITATYRSVGHSRDRDLLLMGRALIRTSDAGTESSHVRGGRLHRADGSLIGSFGEVPALTLEAVRSGARQTRRSADGMHYDVVWPAEETGLPFAVAARLDASWIGPELQAFLWRISGLVLLISVFVSIVTMAIFGRSVLLPMLRLRTSLVRAHQDPTHADRYVLAETRADELGELMDAADRLLHRVSSRLDSQETQLSETTEHLMAVLNNSVASIITIDSNGIVTSFNPAAEKLFGHPAKQVISRNVSMLIPEPHHEAHDGYIADYHRSGKASVIGQTRALVARHRDGYAIPVELSVGEMMVHGEIHFVGFLTDISERVAAEEQLRQAQKMEAIGRLTGGVAHEFNNLLTAIGGFAHLVSRWADNPEKVRDWSQDIIGAADQAASLTSQLLAFSRKQILEPQLVSISQVLKNTETLTRQIMGGEISTHYKITFDVGDENIHVKVDPGQLSQALLNLSINARDAMPGGGALTIASHVMDLDRAAVAGFDQAEPGRYVAISVTDTGTGIDEDTMQKIFEPFFTTKEEGEGTGLGLAMVYGMIQQSGGVITVDSEVDRGTVFTIYLPHSDEDMASLQEAAAGKDTPIGFETVLLVEEDAATRHLVRITLETLGYTVLAADDGMKAAEIFQQCRSAIKLLVAGVSLPGLDGGALAGMMIAETPDLRVLFIAGEGDTNITEEADQIDGSHLLIKPFDPEELAQTVREILDSAPLQTSAA